jgi:RND family efflux transporter MFP subunit
LRQTPEVLAARARVAEAQGALKAARGQLLPKLQGSLGATGSNNALNVFGMKLNQGKATFNDFGAGDFNPADPSSLFIAPSNLNNPGWYQNYQSKLALQIPLYNGGKLWGYLRQSEALLRAARQGDEAARQRLVLQVLKAYEGLRAAQAFVTVARKGETAAKSNLELTDKLYAAGVVSRNDQLRAQLSLGDAQLRRSEAQTNLAKAQEQLRVLIGGPPQRPLRVFETVRVTLPDTPLAVLQRQALAGNPSLRALEERLQAAHVGVNIARSDYLPHFNLVLSEEWNSESIGGGGKPSSTVAGVLSWDLLDFGVRPGSIDQARAAVAKAKAALVDARTKFDRYQALYAQKAVPKPQFQQITTAYQVAKGDYAAAVAALAKANAELSYAEVRAPFAGVVMDKLIDAGQLAAPGQQLLILQSAGHLQVQVQVDANAFDHLRLDQRVAVIVDRGDGKPRRLQGTVERLLQAADPMTHTHSVKIGLPPDSPVQSGAYARVQIDVGARQGILVPPSAVHRRAGIEGVFVVDREGLAAFRMVRLGERSDGGVVVLAGLVAGERVIVRARGELDNGVRIKADGA